METKRYLIDLFRIEPKDKEDVGAKAFNLKQIYDKGFNVPPGIVITTAAFERFLDANNLQEKLEPLSQMSDPAKARSTAKKIRTLFDEATIPNDILSALEFGINKLFDKLPKGSKVAVRSSFLNEDDEASSFAGQMATFLNIEDTQQAIKAVVNCWTSLWSSQAIAYRASRGHKVEPKGGVIVQAQVDAEWAGVMFASDAFGKSGQFVIEATDALGEEIVSGRKDPHRIIIDISKKRMIEYSAPNGEEDMPQETRETLVENAIQINQKLPDFGDFEWALSEGNFYLLQGRPITTGEIEMRPPKDGILWSRVLGEEFWSGAVSPMMFSIVGTAIENAMLIKPITMLGPKYLSTQRYLRLIYDHVFVNLNALEPVVLLIPEWALTDEFLKMFPTKMREKILHEAGYVLPLDLPKAFFRFKRAGAPWWFNDAAKKFYQFIHETAPKLKSIRVPKPTATNEEFNEALNEITNLLEEYLEVSVWGVTYAYLFVPLAAKIIDTWFKPEDRAKLQRLALTNLPDDRNFETTRGLDKLASELKELPCFAQISTEDLDFEQASALMRSTPSGRKFLRNFDEFLKEHGHRAVDRDIFQPRWADEPDVPFSLIKKLSVQTHRQAGNPIPEEDVMKELEKALPIRWLNLFAPFKLPALKAIVHLARTFLPVRENMRFYADMFLYAIRKLVLARATSLVRKGIIEPSDTDLAFFLTRDELFGSKIENDPEFARQLIRKARQRMERYRINSRRRLPAYLLDGEDFEAISSAPIEGEAFYGLPASPGIARGKARVVLAYEDFFNFKPGEVLIVHYLDPSWSSLIPQSAAVITEVGGQLSHGAIIAREYGIPAVAGVSGILDRIQGGEELIVNGNEGVIYMKTTDV